MCAADVLRCARQEVKLSEKKLLEGIDPLSTVSCAAACAVRCCDRCCLLLCAAVVGDATTTTVTAPATLVSGRGCTGTANSESAARFADVRAPAAGPDPGAGLVC